MEYTSEEFSTRIYINDDLFIRSTPTDSKDDLWFTVFNKNGKFCRLDMRSPSFVGLEDETLNLTKENLEDIIKVLNSPNNDEICFLSIEKDGTERTCSSMISQTEGKIWNALIAYSNFAAEKDDPVDLPIPNYLDCLSK